MHCFVPTFFKVNDLGEEEEEYKQILLLLFIKLISRILEVFFLVISRIRI